MPPDAPATEKPAGPPPWPGSRDFFPPFFAALFLLVWSYGFLVFNFSISVDEELHLSGMAGLNVAWLTTGRWAVYLFKVVLGSLTILPFFSGIFALVFLAAASATLHLGFASIRPAGERGTCDWIVPVLIFPTTPVLAFTLCFATFDAEVGFGLFLAALSAVLTNDFILRTRPKYQAVVSSVLLGVAIAVYQPMATVWAAAVCSFMLAAFLLAEAPVAEPRRWVKRFVTHLLLIGGGGLLLYKVVDWAVVAAVGKSGYYESYMNWPRESIRDAVSRLVDTEKDFVLGKLFEAGFGWRLLIGLELAAAVVILVSASRRRLFWMAGALLLTLGLLPFAMSWITGFPLPLRTMFPVAVSCTSPLVIAWHLLPRRGIRLGLLSGLVLVALSNVQWINRALLADFRRFQYDVFLAQQIGREVEKVAFPHGPRAVRIAVIGVYEANRDITGYKCEVLGSSMFEWDGGNPYRVRAFLRALGFGSFADPATADIQRAIAESNTMEPWPAASSVRVVDDLAIVKLSAPTVQQLRNYTK
jgi:hypothetical protein